MEIFFFKLIMFIIKIYKFVIVFVSSVFFVLNLNFKIRIRVRLIIILKYLKFKKEVFFVFCFVFNKD